jgi:hypothetical protein
VFLREVVEKGDVGGGGGGGGAGRDGGVSLLLILFLNLSTNFLLLKFQNHLSLLLLLPPISPLPFNLLPSLNRFLSPSLPLLLNTSTICSPHLFSSTSPLFPIHHNHLHLLLPPPSHSSLLFQMDDRMMEKEKFSFSFSPVLEKRNEIMRVEGRRKMVECGVGEC